MRQSDRFWMKSIFITSLTLSGCGANCSKLTQSECEEASSCSTLFGQNLEEEKVYTGCIESSPAGGAIT